MSAIPTMVTYRHAACQRGFSLIEVSIVTAIVLLLAIISIPAIGGYVIENKVPKVGEELARFILQTKVNAPNGSATPYADIDTRHFAKLVRDSSIFSVSGTDTATRVLHGLGGNGEVLVAPAESGTAFSITLSGVNNVACPSIASIMQRVSESITIAAEGQAAAVVKDPATPYSALTAEAQCAQGDVNTFVFQSS
ncbi:type 4 pilus major pilin [Eoetvoesiella caeni]|uniref:Prepilin-type N-terminal cleavage/methylation domain-containing protein n=1 Tax=Eoetvoesiella caeni TaxID=645616 RepID=A0A366HHT1_9BURK|nr:type 4 pilus major pilin [Eoetvoesiella caeni]MCI2808394.1 prepilin-type N-terminal cleavage/methylation domain-containing protein [Eoetvoesiella caeni]RBP41092.1 prepilin-type N-terminal cleavage/methylation domain-containing protein [Eoetvoesiella caeni]